MFALWALLGCATPNGSQALQPAAASPEATQSVDASRCIATCKRNAMARAVAAEVIERDCIAACTPAPLHGLDPLPKAEAN